MIKQKQILLVGRSGFIGSYLHDKFKDDYRITSVGYSSGLIEDDFHQLDLTKEKDVEIFSKQLPSCDILIFLVGLAHKKGNGKDFNKFQLVNKQTLINIVSMLQNINKLPRKLIFASTISIYGEKIDRDIYHEDSSKEPPHWTHRVCMIKSSLTAVQWLVSWQMLAPQRAHKTHTCPHMQQLCSKKSWILRIVNPTAIGS